MVITCYIGALWIELGDISEGFLGKFYVSLVIKKEGRIYGQFFLQYFWVVMHVHLEGYVISFNRRTWSTEMLCVLLTKLHSF